VWLGRAKMEEWVCMKKVVSGAMHASESCYRRLMCMGKRIDVSVVYCKRKRNILWNVRVFRGIIEALKQQPRPI
jgi:hypothetical protein